MTKEEKRSQAESKGTHSVSKLSPLGGHQVGQESPRVGNKYTAAKLFGFVWEKHGVQGERKRETGEIALTKYSPQVS
jgi:hypothetical protein